MSQTAISLLAVARKPDFLTKLATLLLLCLLTISARAAALFQDNFDEYTTGPLTNQTGNITPWVAHSGAAPINIVSDPTGNSANALQVSQSLAQDVHANLDTNKVFADITFTNLVPPLFTNVVAGVTNITGTSTNYTYAFSPSNSVSTLYASYKIYVTQAPPGGSSGANQTYFGHFYVDSSTFKGRLFLVTNGVATTGTFRIAIENGSGTGTNTIPVDLSVNTAYTLVERYVLSSGQSMVWLNPVNESSGNNATPLDTTSTANILAYAFRQASAGEGTLDVDNFVTGTKFADVVPGSVNAPTILTQPNDTNVFSGASVTFTTLAAGDATLSYQWFSITNGVTNSIAGATSTTLTMASLTTNQSGSVFCVVTNGAGTNVTRSAQLLVSALPIPPTIDTNVTPAISTNTVGDTVSFTVVAHGLPAPAYQWKFVSATNSLVTNTVAGPNASGTNSATLTLTSLTAAQSGSYFVTITNSAGYLTTNSAKAVLTVIPPPFVTIATARGMVDGTFAPTNTTALITIQGIVTTWSDMTGVANTEFYIQDASGGIAVFWSGASGTTNLPPAGALVQVTGPLAAFSGLLEIEPVFGNSFEGVTIISTNNPLPKAQPLVFDPNVSGYPGTTKTATMNAMESMYFVASNVMLNLSTPTFVSGANDIITNNAQLVGAVTNSVLTANFTNQAGQQYVLFINAQSGLPGQTKYTGPVTIYGILGYFSSAGFEFTPSRFADVISYINETNVFSNVIRHGDLTTNSFTENILEPGETLTTYVSIGDPEGGTVTLSPSTDGLPGDASWSNVTSGQTGTAVFHFTPTQADAGVKYVVSIGVTSTSGNAFSNSFTVYVPTAAEQQVRISEFLANPTTNSSAPNFNPLQRSSATTGIVTNDQYIELVNQSGSSIDTSSGANGWEVDLGSTQVMVFDALGSPPSISSSNAIVIYGGGTPAPTLPVNNFAATSGKLGLPTTGTGTIILRNGSGNLIDRVIYSAGDLNTNGSLSRFPTINSPFAPQPYISTNLTTAGLQYDGSPWNQPYKVPTGVNNVGISVVNGQVLFNFSANTSQANTLWGASTVTGPYSVLFGGLFPGGSGSFTNAASGMQQFYYISTQ